MKHMGATTWALIEDGVTMGYLESLESLSDEELKELQSPEGSNTPALLFLMKAGCQGERVALSPPAFGETEEQWTIPPVPGNEQID